MGGFGSDTTADADAANCGLKFKCYENVASIISCLNERANITIYEQTTH